MLQVDDVSVSFGGLRALRGVSLEAPEGRVTGLIGPNGAGKTTLFNVITGLQRPTAGRVRLHGRDVTRRGTRTRARAGLGRTFQRLEVFGSLSVHENVQLAAEVQRKRSSRDGRRPAAIADALLERVGLSALAGTPAAELPTGNARLLELARALAGAPSLLLLDEPGSGLSDTESAALASLLSSLAADGMAVLLVEHDVELVMSVCAHLYVLDFGRLLSAGTPADVAADPAVQAAYLGTEPLGLELDEDVPAPAAP